MVSTDQATLVGSKTTISFGCIIGLASDGRCLKPRASSTTRACARKHSRAGLLRSLPDLSPVVTSRSTWHKGKSKNHAVWRPRLRFKAFQWPRGSECLPLGKMQALFIWKPWSTDPPGRSLQSYAILQQMCSVHSAWEVDRSASHPGRWHRSQRNAAQV